MNNVISILGSLNMDIILGVSHLPECGETILAQGVRKAFGGKGANQAVAAARLGNCVYMIGKVGDDEHGRLMRDALSKDNINAEYLFLDEKNPSGTAYIVVDSQGNNSIIVDSGANMAITEDEVDKASGIIRQSAAIISQFETPLSLTIKAFQLARENGVLTILNPAPAAELPEELLAYTDILIPNETETELLTGIRVSDEESARFAASKLMEGGCRYVVITLGEKGAAAVSKEAYRHVPAFKTQAVDTTAAGDAFIGAFTSKLVDGKRLDFDSIVKAVEFGNLVSSIAVQRHGAQPSLPYLTDVLGK